MTTTSNKVSYDVKNAAALRTTVELACRPAAGRQLRLVGAQHPPGLQRLRHFLRANAITDDNNFIRHPCYLALNSIQLFLIFTTTLLHESEHLGRYSCGMISINAVMNAPCTPAVTSSIRAAY